LPESWDLIAVDDYIKLNTLDNEDWFDNDEVRKTALLNVSKRTLDRVFKSVAEIPDEAVYIYANTLSSAFNDTMVQAQRGVASFNVRGISFTFKDWMKTDLKDLIPEEVYEIVGIPKKRMKWTVL
jgi:hypothetical protein